MDLSRAVGLDENPSSPLEENPPLPQPRRGLFFRGPADPQEDLPSLQPEEAGGPTTPDLLDDDGSASATEWTSDESDGWSTDDPTSSPTSSAGSAKPLTKAALKQTVRRGIGIGSAIAHRVAANTEGQQLVGLYIADEEDQAAIGDPLAEIAHRRGGIAGKVSPDTADAIQSMLGIANYFTKQVAKVVQAREHDAQVTARPAAQPGATFHE